MNKFAMFVVGVVFGIAFFVGCGSVMVDPNGFGGAASTNTSTTSSMEDAGMGVDAGECYLSFGKTIDESGEICSAGDPHICIKRMKADGYWQDAIAVCPSQSAIPPGGVIVRILYMGYDGRPVMGSGFIYDGCLEGVLTDWSLVGCWSTTYTAWVEIVEDGRIVSIPDPPLTIQISAICPGKC